ncbi:MAG: hypothetical protein RIQ53_3160 [Pseudomonadota bacterium]|jgi:ElaB/YqjD/DUF883 family membrane-anchored ribosome-binding protein
MNEIHPSTIAETVDGMAPKADRMAANMAAKAEGAIDAAKGAADDALDSLKSQVGDLRRNVPDNLARAASQVDELIKRGMDKARDTQAAVRERASQAGEQTRGYIRDEPMKSVLIAAAAGATLAAVISWLGRSRGSKP